MDRGLDTNIQPIFQHECKSPLWEDRRRTPKRGRQKNKAVGGVCSPTALPCPGSQIGSRHPVNFTMAQTRRIGCELVHKGSKKGCGQPLGDFAPYTETIAISVHAAPFPRLFSPLSGLVFHAIAFHPSDNVPVAVGRFLVAPIAGPSQGRCFRPRQRS